MKRKYFFIGVPVILLVGAIGGYFYWRAHLPVGQMTGNQLVFRGETYVADINLQADQLFYPSVGRTQGGDGIGSISGEDPKDYVFVVGEMWQGVYRRSTLTPPAVNMATIAGLELQGLSKSKKSSVDITTQSPHLIQDLVQIITTTDLNKWDYDIVPSHDQYGIVVHLEGHPGLKYDYYVQGDSQHMYLEVDRKEGKYMKIAGTELAKWILAETR